MGIFNFEWSSFQSAEQTRLAQGASVQGHGVYIRAVKFIPKRDGDSPILPDLLGQTPEDEQIGAATDDEAYDTHRCHPANIARDAVPISRIRKNGQS